MTHDIRKAKLLTTKVETDGNKTERRTLHYIKPDKEEPKLILKNNIDQPLVVYGSIVEGRTTEYESHTNPLYLGEQLTPLQRELNSSKVQAPQLEQKLTDTLKSYGWYPQQSE